MSKINYIKPINQWREVSIGRKVNFNWSTFSFISIELEWDRTSQDGYLQVVLMGLGVFIHWLGKEWQK